MEIYPDKRSLARARADLYLTPEVLSAKEKWGLTRRQVLRWRGTVPRKYRADPKTKVVVLIYGQALGPLLRRLRVRQQWLAAQLGVSQSTVSRWASGGGQPQPGQLAALRLVLKPLIEESRADARRQRADGQAKKETKTIVRRLRSRLRQRAWRARQTGNAA